MTRSFPGARAGTPQGRLPDLYARLRDKVKTDTSASRGCLTPRAVFSYVPRTMRRAVAILAAAFAALGVVLVVNAVHSGSRQIAVEPMSPLAVDGAVAARHLAGALRFRTVSYQDPTRSDRAEFVRLHRYLEETFPRVHGTLGKEALEGGSLLFTWKGRDPALPPLLLLAHLDVVPVDAATEDAWTHPPFAGEIADGYVWGRGAMDDKVAVLGLLEAAELLLTEGFQPRRTISLAFGHDEEVGGTEGAVNLAQLLRARGAAPAFVLDEGLAVTEGLVSGVPAPVALVGIAEKGYLTIELLVEGEGGHSSTPPPETAIGILAAAVRNLERHQAPPAIAGPARRLFEVIGPEMPFPRRLALANLWLFAPIVEWRLAADPTTNALIRTTTAPTMFESGVKENVLPGRARAVVNFRIRPGESIEDVLEHARAAVADPRVRIAAAGTTRSEPSPESSVESNGFTTIARTIRQVFPEAVVAPSLVFGATDARHYTGLCADVYRFLPYRVGPDDVHRPHGIDERLSLADAENAVRFYAQLMRNAAGP